MKLKTILKEQPKNNDDLYDLSNSTRELKLACAGVLKTFELYKDNKSKKEFLKLQDQFLKKYFELLNNNGYEL